MAARVGTRWVHEYSRLQYRRTLNAHQTICKFVNLKQHIEFNTVRGVADHNTILTNQNGFFTFNESYYNGAKTPYGDASRSAPIHWGSSDFFFVEDNDYTGKSPNASNYVTDGYTGARFVIRHNNIIDGAIAEHGTDSTGKTRKLRGARDIQ